MNIDDLVKINKSDSVHRILNKSKDGKYVLENVKTLKLIKVDKKELSFFSKYIELDWFNKDMEINSVAFKNKLNELIEKYGDLCTISLEGHNPELIFNIKYV